MSKKIKKSGVEEPVNGMITGDYKIGDETYRGTSRADIDEFFNGQDISEEEKKNSGDALEELLKNSKYDLADALKKFVSFGKGFLSTLDPHGDVYKKLESALKSGNSDIVKAVEAFEAHNRDLERQLAETQEALKKEKAKRKGPGVIMQSAHLVERMNGNRNLEISDLFNSLETKTKAAVTQHNIKAGHSNSIEILEGLESLSGMDRKIVASLCILLGTTNQQLQPGEPGYYQGNAGTGVMAFVSDSSKDIKPGLNFSFSELAKMVKGGKKPCGKDIKHTKAALEELNRKEFLVKYEETTTYKGPKGKNLTRIRALERFEKIVWINNVSEKIYEEGASEPISDKKRVSVHLSHIFIHQIGAKWIPMPIDLIDQITEAYGSVNVPQAVFIFIDMLRAWHSGKNYSPSINADNLYLKLCPINIKARKIGQAKKTVELCFKAATHIKLLESYTLVKGAKGQDKFEFEVSKSWLKF